MLPETAIPVPEIMQTEEVGPDEIPILNPLPDTEMTVKEDIELPVELPQKTNISNECTSIDATTQLTALEEHASTFEERVIGHKFNRPFENLRSVSVPLLRESTHNANLREISSSGSVLSSIASSSTSPSPQQKIEKEKNRGKRRSRWKLKFHHQALPPEYLDHYEATVAQQAAAAAARADAARAKSGGAKGKQLPSAATPAVPADVTAADPAPVAHKSAPGAQKCHVKVEHETQKHEASPSGNNNLTDQLHVLPIQTLSISDDNDSSSKPQDDISIINEKASLVGEKTHFSNEKIVSGKGLLGTLLTSTITSDTNSKSLIDNERKRKSVIMSTSSGNSSGSLNRSPTPSNASSSSNAKVRNYQDLPYMGEITLDNMKPRRGRKPKKADICHLIYKNYGTTVFPGTPLRSNFMDNDDWTRRKMQEASQNVITPMSLNASEVRLKQENGCEPSLKCKPLESLKQPPHVSHSDVQNRIISSLLEKRLMTSQDSKKSSSNNSCFVTNSSFLERNDNIMNSQLTWAENCKQSTSVNDEPLNLCVKDLNQLKIRLLRKHGNFYEPRSNDVVVKSEPPSPNNSQELDTCDPHSECMTKFQEDANTSETSNKSQTKLLRSESDSTCDPYAFSEGDCSRATTPGQVVAEPGSSGPSALPGGYIYWPSAGVFVHPMALQSQFLYYQKMGAIPIVPISPAEPQTLLSSHVPQVSLIPHINSTLSQNPQNVSKTVVKKDHKCAINKTLIPKAFSMMMDTSPKPATAISPSEVPFSKLKRLAPLGNPPVTTTPTKRKRSAIFIPPMPSENSSNPTTEVSICKFKFTGGAKPSLQEKKMLSVDSGGNFRYYSGTGDKSMRGYEFFPRETLQQSGSVGGTSSEQFLAASTASNDRVGNNSFLAQDEGKSLQLQHSSELVEQSSKLDVINVPSSDAENGVASCVPLNYELPNQSGCVRKKNDNSSKSRNISVSGDNERFTPGCKVEEQATSSQMRMRRKRKTRKSLAREKLEQTFKEKGFLIQTQQLESAEGATYCKFRQLRKFTRYLFRSWKDYLPGNVREMSVAAGVAGPETSPPSDVGPIESEIDGELSCSNSPTPSFQHISESPKTFPGM